MSPYNKRRGAARYLPIRKIVTVAVAAGLTWAARRAGMDLGSESANEAAVVLVGVAAGYMENDPRVVSLLKATGDWIDHVDVSYQAADGTTASVGDPAAEACCKRPVA